jgi:hypothetical protein
VDLNEHLARTWLGEQWSARDFWDSLAFEIHWITRKTRIKKIRDNRKNRRAFLDTYRRHCGETAFADVEQGIVRREGVRLRVIRSNEACGSLAPDLRGNVEASR